MRKTSKRLKQARSDVEAKEVYSIEEAVDALQKTPKVKFDESVELHFHLNINPKNTDQMVRGTVVLPHGTGKKVRIAVFCKGETEQKAKQAGADFVGAQELIDKVAKGFLDFDVVVATPDMMRDLSKLGKILGPRGLMPTPKAGTVTQDVEKAINDLKAGKIEFKSDKQAGIHLGVGKRSFEKAKLLENIDQVLDAINTAKPNAVKGQLLKGVALTTTMGPGNKGSHMKVGELFRDKLVNRIKGQIDDNESIFLISYSQLNGQQTSELRKSLRQAGANVYVAKNNLAKKALNDLEKADLAKNISGQTAFVWGNADSVEISKILVNFTKEFEQVSVQGGLLEGTLLNQADVKKLADLPSREVLLSTLLGTIQAPVTRLMNALNAKSRDLLSILKQLSEKKGGSENV